MKKHLLTAIAIAVFISTMAIASAQAQNAPTMTLTIAFEFTIAGKTLPAGDYLVRLESSLSTLKVQNRDNSKAAFVLINPLPGRDIQKRSKVVFNRYGSQYFLAEVWIAGSSTGKEARRSSEERAIRRELAVLKHKRDTVTIAARSN